jgi:hypothetical protein
MFAVHATGNTIMNLDATGLGYTSGDPTQPVNTGSACGIYLGTDTSDDTYAQSGWIVQNNIVKNVTDSRNGSASGVNPETQGLRVMSSGFASIIGNTLYNIAVTGDNITGDNEGIYLKCPFAIVMGNTFYNAGTTEGSVCIKGRDGSSPGDTEPSGVSMGRGGICIGNTFYNNLDRDTTAITIDVPGWTVAYNHIDGYGGNTSSGSGGQARYCPIYTAAGDGSRTKIDSNWIYNTKSGWAIYLQSFGTDIEITRNVIDGVLATAPLSSYDRYGIYCYLSSTVYGTLSNDGLRISGNIIRNVAKPSGRHNHGIFISLPVPGEEPYRKILRLVVSDNETPESVDYALTLDQGEFDDVTIRGNNFEKATIPLNIARSAVITGLEASGNRGWLRGSVTNAETAVTANTATDPFTISVPGAESGDSVKVWATTDIYPFEIQSAWISASGQVSVRLLNTSTSNEDLVESTFNAVVEKIAI